MNIRTFIDEGLGNSSYLVDIGDRRALALDPPRDVSAHRRAAEEGGLSIAYSLETHLHADFISGSRELSAVGATVVGARAANLAFPHRGLDGGETLDLGGLTLEANPLLAASDEDAFVTRLAESFGTYPTYFKRLREVNRRGPRIIGAVPPLARLDLPEVDRLLAEGAELIDARSMTVYAAGHIPGSLSIALRPAFASWLGWMVPSDRPLVFVLDEGQDRSDLIRQALGIGYEELAGEVDGGFDTWRNAGRAGAETTLTRTAATGPVLDVRQASEVESGHVRGATPIELGALSGDLAEVPEHATVMCGHGERAMTAASLLERGGREVAVFEGSPRDWAKALGEPLERTG